jgi:hypothetical protein
MNLLKIALLLFVFFSSIQQAYSTRYYITTDGTGTGTSWTDALNSVQTAIDMAVEGDEIWVKTGTYTPDESDRTVAFTLSSGVKLYGGFGGSESSLEDRLTSDIDGDGSVSGWEFLYPTVLSGEIQEDDDVSNNSQHIVVIPSGVSSNTVFNGFTVANAYTDVAYKNSIVYAAGIIAFGGKVENCLIQDCQSVSSEVSYGGGVYVSDSEFTDCKIQDCSISGDDCFGGGVFAEDAIIESCTITACYAVPVDNFKAFGGAVYCSGSQMINCIVTDSYISGLEGYGGGLYVLDGTVVNSIITNNEATAYAGGVYGLQAHIANCVVANNKVTSSTSAIGGGAYGDSETVFYNTVFWGNETAGTSAQIKSADGDVINCAFDSQDVGTDNLNISSDNTGSEDGVLYAMFYSPTNFVGLSDDEEANEESLLRANWNIDFSSSLIEAGDNDAFNEAIYGDLNGDGDDYDDIDSFEDLDGELRLFNATVDIGAYEPAFIDLTLPDPITIEYGLSLGEITLSGGSAKDKRDEATIAGAYSFTDTETVPAYTAETVNYRVVFTPEDLDNYVEVYDSLSVTVTQKELSLSGLVAEDKVYDGTTWVSFSGTAVLEGIVDTDDVTLDTGDIDAAFEDKYVGEDKEIVFSGYSLSGSDAGNYTLSLSSGTASITAKAVSISALSAEDKVYDGTTDATYAGTPEVEGAISGDDVTVDVSEGAAFFDSKDVGVDINVSFSGFALAGADASNYTLSQPANSTASISELELIVEGVSVIDREYDGSTDAEIDGTAMVSGVIEGDELTLNTSFAIAAFSDKNIGEDKAVTFSGYLLTGADAINYSLVQPTGITASISSKLLSISGLTAEDKDYDGTTSASLTGAATLDGVVSGEDVSLDTGSILAEFEDANVGEDKIITVTGIGLSGTDKDNYTLDSYLLTADILAIEMLISADDQTKVYGDSDPELSYTITSGSLVGTDVFSGSLTRESGQDAGTYAINQGTLSLSSNYNITFSSGVFTINQSSNEISFELDSPVVFGDTEQITLSASASSGLTVVFTSSDSEVATVSGNTLSIHSYGTVTITASEEGDDNFKTASPVENELLVNLDVVAVAKNANMVLIDNSDEQFDAYQWYRNESIISGAEKQYYYSSEGLSGEYYCVVTTLKGDQFTSNSLSTSSVLSMSVYPSPAIKGASVTIEISNGSPDFEQVNIIKVYSITGELVTMLDNVEELNQLTIDKAGIYIIKCEGALECSKKLIVK